VVIRATYRGPSLARPVAPPTGRVLRRYSSTPLGFGINVTDLDRSVEFYTNVLGLEEDEDRPGELHEVLVGADDRTRSCSQHADPPGAGAGQRFEKIVLSPTISTRCTSAPRPGWRVGQGTRSRASWMKGAARSDGYLLEIIEQNPPVTRDAPAVGARTPALRSIGWRV
jgi:catechol 2,3-dioxygenase-like lactoylglutathione lyase family enzyme